MDHQTAAEIELAIAHWLGTRSHLIVPNVSWGLHLHECDLLVLSKSGYGTEIEIKVSASDLRRDRNKHHHHESSKIKYLYFAMPLCMEKYVVEVPEQAGVILVSREGRCIIKRKPTANKKRVRFTADETLGLARLGTLRMWSLKEKYLQIVAATYRRSEPDYSI